jgi:serine/threonine protein kinase
MSDTNSPPAQQVDPFAGLLVAQRYRLEYCVGTGGWSLLYKASDLQQNRKVAVKLLHLPFVLNKDKVERFNREARTSAKLSHPNICRVYDSGMLPTGQPYIVMEYLNGMNLADLLELRGPMSPKQLVSVFDQVLAGLEHAHERKVLHRDIKPSNVFVEDNGHVKLVDFGLAKFLAAEDTSTSITDTGQTIGTPSYMSPEQCQGMELDERSDIYSVGCTLYEAATGTRAFSGSALDCMRKQLTSDPPSIRIAAPNLRVPLGVEAVIFKALEKDVSRRYQSAAELRRHLHQSCDARALPYLRWHKLLPQLGERLQKSAVVIVSVFVGFILAFALITGLLKQQQEQHLMAVSQVVPQAERRTAEAVEQEPQEAAAGERSSEGKPRLGSRLANTQPKLTTRTAQDPAKVAAQAVQQAPAKPIARTLAQDPAKANARNVQQYAAQTAAAPSASRPNIASKLESPAVSSPWMPWTQQSQAPLTPMPPPIASAPAAPRMVSPAAAEEVSHSSAPSAAGGSEADAIRLNNEAVSMLRSDPRTAIGRLEQALRINPGYQKARVHLGVAYHNLANREAAAGDLSTALNTYAHSLKILNEVVGPSHAATQATQRDYELCQQARGGAE